MHTIYLDVGPTTKVVVASDLHVGDPRVVGTYLNVFDVAMQLESPDVIILSGDVLEGDRATAQQKDRLAHACAAARHVIVLNGNHDSDATREFATRIHAEFGDCVVGGNSDYTFAVEHGHRFDATWKRIPCVGRLAIWLNLLIYTITRFDVQRWFRSFRCIINNLKKQHLRARTEWLSKDIVVTGHTHIPTGEATGSGYFNSGDWLIHKTYVVILGGRARLERIP